MNKSLIHYRQNLKFLIRDCNKRFPLPYYFSYMIGRRGEYKIADLGCGPVCTLGGAGKGATIRIYASDILQPEYVKMIDELGIKMEIPIEYQDMENLTYEDEFFDVVHCVNALDHTRNAKKAIEEMKRVCKKGGWIYLRHAPDQLNQCRGGHYWNASINGFSNRTEHIDLEGFTTFLDGYFIISTMQKQ